LRGAAISGTQDDEASAEFLILGAGSRADALARHDNNAVYTS